MGQPTEGALLSAAMKNGMYNIQDRFVRLQEYPFSSEQKMMAVKCVPKYEDNKQDIFFVKGALEKILPKCTKYFYNGTLQTLTNKKEQEFMAEAHEIGRKGLRVVALAKGPTLQELVYLGIVGICDPPRPFVRESITTLLQSGVQVKMVTGDAIDTAVAIGLMIYIMFFCSKLMVYNFSSNDWSGYVALSSFIGGTIRHVYRDRVGCCNTTCDRVLQSLAKA